MDIMKRFGMLDYKAIATPVVSNLKLLCDASLYSVDAMMYHHDWFIDVPDEYETKHMLCCEHHDPVPGGSETCSPGCCKACIEVP